MINRRIASLAIFASGILIAPLQSVAAPAEGPVWHWFGVCVNGHKVELQVLLDGVAIYASSFPACPMLRESIISEPKQRILEFTLPPKAQQRLRAPAKTSVEGNIWEAGSETDGLLLGVSFATKSQVLLNTLHYAEIGKTTTSQLARGLVVVTSMAK